jgi:hypothetical protein
MSNETVAAQHLRRPLGNQTALPSTARPVPLPERFEKLLANIGREIQLRQLGATASRLGSGRQRVPDQELLGQLNLVALQHAV